MLYLLSLLACPPSSDNSSPAVVNPAKPFCTWEEGICTDANQPKPLDGDLLILHICLDYDSGMTTCSGGGWRILDDGTWTPSQCGEGFYYRACISY